MEQMQWLQMPQMKQSTGTQDLSKQILQAALNQKSQNAASLAAQPQAGQTLPGGAMNITPATATSGTGLLSKLFGSGGIFGGRATGVADTGNRGVADLLSNSDAAKQAREAAATRLSNGVLRLGTANNTMSPMTSETALY